MKGLEIGGELLDPERRYRLATHSHLSAGGERLLELGREVQDTCRLLHILLMDELLTAGEVTLPAENRVRC